MYRGADKHFITFEGVKVAVPIFMISEANQCLAPASYLLYINDPTLCKKANKLFPKCQTIPLTLIQKVYLWDPHRP